MTESELLVLRIDRLGTIRLNRPEALNSLTLGMVRAFSEALDRFCADPGIEAVLVDGAGDRGLCAGGDIRRLFELRDAGHEEYKIFWREEYQLNARIASFPKPYVVIMDGVVMGGGVGLSAHGNRRVVTERTRLAMPETGIGFIPDVGGTWLLTRNGGGGVYMALCGAAIGAADAIHVGLADIAIDSQDIPDLRRRLSLIRAAGDVDSILSSLARPQTAGVLKSNAPLLDRVMRGARIEEIIDGLLLEGSPFAREVAGEIGQKSPTSLKATLALLKRGRAAAHLETCLVNEFRAACSLLESHDLYEGIRAAVIDKDRRPRWLPASLDEVDEATIARILAGTGDTEPTFPPQPQRS